MLTAAEMWILCFSLASWAWLQRQNRLLSCQPILFKFCQIHIFAKYLNSSMMYGTTVLRHNSLPRFHYEEGFVWKTRLQRGSLKSNSCSRKFHKIHIWKCLSAQVYVRQLKKTWHQQLLLSKLMSISIHLDGIQSR